MLLWEKRLSRFVLLRTAGGDLYPATPVVKVDETRRRKLFKFERKRRNNGSLGRLASDGLTTIRAGWLVWGRAMKVDATYPAYLGMSARQRSTITGLQSKI